MSFQGIKGNVAEMYFLKTGEVKDASGLNDFHPGSNVDIIIVNIEDGGGDNTMAQINFSPATRQNWSSVWFPLFFKGFYQHRISNESVVRTFARYYITVPSVITAMNKNNRFPLAIKLTARQAGGINFVGAFDSLETLEEEHPATEELANNLSVAYVYGVSNGNYYQVEYDSDNDEYVWVETDNPLARLEYKAYNLGEIVVQGGYDNTTPITPIPDVQYNLIWQEINNISMTVEDIVRRIDDLEIEKSDLRYDLDEHIENKDNPHEVTAEQVNTYEKDIIDEKDYETLQEAKNYTNDIAQDKLDKVWQDIAQQTTSLLNDEVVINRGGGVYKMTVATLLSNVAVTELFVIVEELPEIGQINKIYLVPREIGEENNVFEEYIWINSEWENIGSISIDLSDYYTKTEVNALLNGKLNILSGVTTSPQAYVKSASGTQIMVDVTPELAPYKIVQRNADNQILVPLIPTATTHSTSKSYVDNNFLNKGNLLGTADLNTITSYGLYIQNTADNATPERNYPVSTVGSLFVMKTNDTGNNCIQVYFSGQGTYMRYFSASWSYWIRIATYWGSEQEYLTVALEPYESEHAASKWYVDNRIDNLPTPMRYIGEWNATTNTPTLTSPDVSKHGYTYTVVGSGTRFGIEWTSGDVLVYNESGIPVKWDIHDAALENKLDKVTTPSTYQVYGISQGNQTMYNVAQAPSAYGLAQRGGSGQIQVPLTPSASNEATSKNYVDEINTKFLSRTATSVSSLPFGKWYMEMTTSNGFPENMFGYVEKYQQVNSTTNYIVKIYKFNNAATHYIGTSVDGVITWKQFVDKQYVDDLVGDIQTLLEEI
jgi:hypothetical protein